MLEKFEVIYLIHAGTRTNWKEKLGIDPAVPVSRGAHEPRVRWVGGGGVDLPEDDEGYTDLYK